MDGDHSPHLYHLFLHCAKLHHKHAICSFNRTGIYRGQPYLMKILHDHPGISLRTLAARMESEPATVTRMIRRMEAHGLIRREMDPTDSRIHHFYLTEQGEQKRLETEAVHTELARRLFRGFTEDEKILLEDAFSRMTENIRSEGK